MALSLSLLTTINATADNATLYPMQVILTNHTAPAGSAIYGGLIENCIPFDPMHYMWAFATTAN